MAPTLTLIALPGIPLVAPGDDMVELVLRGYAAADLQVCDGDVLILAQKIVSKAEGRHVSLAEIVPGAEACALAAETGKDARLAELILRESRDVLRKRRGTIIVEHVLGHVQANAGIDRSNIASDDARDARVLLLPANPDASARGLRAGMRERTGADVAVIINDSAGRAWRNGVVGFALGCAGILALRDMVGHPDLFGRPLEITQIATADELAAAGSLLMGQADEATPIVLARGMRFARSEEGIRSLLRPRHQDLFR